MQLKSKKYKIISMMSGTSLDGVDIACCIFQTKHPNALQNQTAWSFQLQHAETYPYNPHIINLIAKIQQSNTTFLEFKALELQYTQFIITLILKFIAENNITQVDYLALHGHTIFHRPHQKITVQITNLSYVAAATNLDVIGNFRQLDVLRGGEGAPLAPYAQEIFQGDVFINFGGIANVGYNGKGYDINYCNLVLNHYAYLIEGKEFDNNGSIGRTGIINNEIFSYLNVNWKNSQTVSLERQKAEMLLAQLSHRFQHISNKDHLATFYTFLASEILQAIKSLVETGKQREIQRGKQLHVICTGGGAKNQYLIELLNKQSQNRLQFVRPSQSLIDFKEAILFGFLGVKFLQNVPNCSLGIGGMLVKGNTKYLKQK